MPVMWDCSRPQGDFICMLDADDWLDPMPLSRLVEAFDDEDRLRAARVGDALR